MTIPYPIRPTLVLALLALTAPASMRAATRSGELQDVLRRDPTNAAACVALARSYMQSSRETGDPSYEAKAESLVARALAADSAAADAWILRGTMQLSRHDFAGALESGEHAHRLAPRAADALAVIADAHVELGHDSAAVAVVQRMVNERPSLAAYARVSYLRELHGDRAGAIGAMLQAMTTGGGQPADAAWCAARAGLLCLGADSLDAASRLFDRALVLSPRCVSALAGAARVAAARGDSARAAALYERANATLPLVENIVALAELHDVRGRARDAARHYALASALLADAHARGVDTDLDAALFEARRTDDLAALLARTRSAHARRPSAMADHVLAWVLYRADSLAEAHATIERALRHQTDDPTVLYHAGVIFAAAGDAARAHDLLTRALAASAALSPRDAVDARRAHLSLEPLR